MQWSEIQRIEDAERDQNYQDKQLLEGKQKMSTWNIENEYLLFKPCVFFFVIIQLLFPFFNIYRALLKGSCQFCIVVF